GNSPVFYEYLSRPNSLSETVAPGDLLVLGSDGVFDRVPPDFPVRLLGFCVEAEGDVAAAIETALDELAGLEDEAGFVCDDNLSLGLLVVPGARPLFGPGFWARVAGERPEREVGTRC
ncbi:MAG: hypothetical protein QME96_14995, partial [Myxococcota bacterium]|nr:hypothetical protein [Myxococcota bacterium]